jgi:nucleoside-diphosphate-sugar epimerase|tara:strand:+ start:375 stop:1343 length:969 start_codon:yes stop_codon:yes gene_type:complete
MNILVTGGCGFIGHNVVANLQSLDHNVVLIDNKTTYGIVPQAELDYLVTERMKKITSPVYPSSIESADSVDCIINKHNVEVIVHMASFPRQKVVNADPAMGSRTMMEGLLNLLESATRHNVRRFVYISSSMVYGNFKDNVKEDAACNPEGQYGIMKLAGEWLVKDYSRRTGMEVVIIRPSAVYGPLDVEDRVVAKFMLTAMRGGQLSINGASEALDFTYVTDLAAGIVSATITPAAANHTYNLTRSHSVSLLEAAETIIKIVGSGTMQIKARDLNFPSRGALNIDAARTDLNYAPCINIAEGFQKYYESISNSVLWSTKTVP